MAVIPIAAFSDNYLWLIIDADAPEQARYAAIVDPGDARPVAAMLDCHGITLAAMLITHHHFDHTSGIKALLARGNNIPVYGPAGETIPAMTHPLRDGDNIELPHGLGNFRVLEVPGHTAGHIAYYAAPRLFCGDTLFAGGCGRLFEGTAEQLWRSLNKLAALPDNTLIYCAHEYTLNNLQFARVVEPDNLAITRRLAKVEQLRRDGLPTVPSTLAEEKATNPFLRCDQDTVARVAEHHAGRPLPDPAAVFAAVRRWKDQF